MCLAVPGKIIAVTDNTDDPVTGRAGTVDFQGNRVDVSLAMIPEAKTGDWVLVHAGFALQVLDESEAMETWDYLKQAGLDQTLGLVQTAEPGPPEPQGP